MRLQQDEWEQFCKLYEKLEGTNWYDTRDVAYMVIGALVPSGEEQEIRNKNLTVTQLLQLAYMRVRTKKCLILDDKQSGFLTQFVVARMEAYPEDRLLLEPVLKQLKQEVK